MKVTQTREDGAYKSKIRKILQEENGKSKLCMDSILKVQGDSLLVKKIYYYYNRGEM
jgi:hypothetical protein